MIENELRDYIQSEIVYDREEPITPDEPLLNGALDSTDVLRLVVFVEERYAVRIDDDDLVPENFATVRSLAALVGRKTGRPALSPSDEGEPELSASA